MWRPFREDQGSERGAEGAGLVVEIRSPEDETYSKLSFYAACGVREMPVLHPSERRAELYRLVEDESVRTRPDDNEALHSEVLGIALRNVEGKLRISWSDGTDEF